MTTSRNRLLLKAFVGASVVSTLGSGIYLGASGARLGAPLLFVLLAVLTLCASVFLLLRSAAALVFEPQVDEVRVATGRRRKELEREKQQLLKAIKEIEFDHEMGKISEADFRDISGRYRARAVRVMRQLDEGATDYRKQVERDAEARAGERLAAAMEKQS